MSDAGSGRCVMGFIGWVVNVSVVGVIGFYGVSDAFIWD